MVLDYRTGSDCGWSDVFWFKTFPSGTWSPRLAVYGDMGNINAVSLPRLQRETQSGMYDMILHIGDFAYDMFDVSQNKQENEQCFAKIFRFRKMGQEEMNSCDKSNLLQLTYLT